MYKTCILDCQLHLYMTQKVGWFIILSAKVLAEQKIYPLLTHKLVHLSLTFIDGQFTFKVLVY